MRPLRRRDELDLFRSIPYVLNDEIESDLDAGRRRLKWLWVALRGDRLVGRIGWWTRSAGEPPVVLDIFDISSPEADDGDALAATAMRAVRSPGSTPPQYVRLLAPDWHGDPVACATSSDGGPCLLDAVLVRWLNGCGSNGTPAVWCRRRPGACNSAGGQSRRAGRPDD